MSKTARYVLASCIVVVLLFGSFSGGILVGWLLPDRTPVFARAESTPEVVESIAETREAPKSREELFSPFWEVWDLVEENFVDQPVDEVAMMRGAIRGMLEALGDQHTSYMDPDEFQQANMQMDGDYEGIGAWVDTTGEYLVIISPMPGSPAERAGLKSDDVVIAVDGEDMTNVDGNLVLKHILGPAGTDVTLTIRREGEEEPFDVTITREKIVIPSVTHKMLENDIGYVQVTTFGEDTTPDLKVALTDIMKNDPKGLVLDLRNNGGGFLDTAIEVISQFIPEGVVMYEEYGDGTRQTFEAQPNGLATEIPLVVLVNEGSASASEITAGAIQDLDRGQLVGVTTYGKGSVQNWIPLKDNQGAARITIARWLTPNGRLIHEEGLEPDVVVEITDEDIEAERDPQLDKAIELLTADQ